MGLLTEQEITGCWMANANPEAYENYTLKEHILRSSKDVEAAVIEKIKAQGPTAYWDGCYSNPYFRADYNAPDIDKNDIPPLPTF